MGTAIIAKETPMTEEMNYENRDDVIVCVEQVPVSNLKIDSGEDGYQRPVWQEAVARIVREFDPNQFDVITVSLREDGTYWVVDGHHRVAAARELGMTSIACRIIYGLSRDEEADLFNKLAKGRRSITPYDQLRAEIASGSKDAIAYRQVLYDNGFMPDHTTAHQPREMSEDRLFPLRSITATRTIWSMDNGETLDKVLTVVREAWAQTEPGKALHVKSVRALARLLSRYEEIDLDRLIRVLRETSPTVIIARGSSRAHTLGEKVPVGIALEMLDMYNRSIRGRSSKLSVDRIF